MNRILLGLLAATAFVGCATPDDASDGNPNEGFLRDFLDGKFDAAGHPLNAKIAQVETLCAGSGSVSEGAIRLGRTCVGALPGTDQVGDMTASVRIRVRSAPSSGTVILARLLGNGGIEEVASKRLTVSQIRGGSWIDLPLRWYSSGLPLTLELTTTQGSLVDADYVEVFPARFGLVAAPGSGVYADSDKLVFELPEGRKLDKIELDDVDISSRMSTLLQQGKATRTTTNFRTIFEVAVGDLAPERKATSELEMRSNSLAARVQLHREATPCTYEGDPNGVKVLITGFQPFPADGWHDNVSKIAVTSLDPTQLRGAQVMRVVMPVEYDRAAAQVTDMVERCAPDAIISFGQGGGAIALERTAYNLQDTGEVAGGVPDNRGIIRAAAVIDADAPAQRNTLLPLDAIESALVDLGESPRYSTDPGRYICNNVMFNNVGLMTARGGVGGFIHLPYETSFDAEARARYGKVALAAVQATADSLR